MAQYLVLRKFLIEVLLDIPNFLLLWICLIGSLPFLSQKNPGNIHVVGKAPNIDLGDYQKVI